MREVICRRMTVDDVDAVHAIETEAFAHPWTREDFVREMTENACARYLVAEKDGRVIGFAGIWVVLDEGHVTNIAETASERGQGYGRLLMSALMQYAANLGVTYATLEVRRSNVPAQNLYKKLDFEFAGVRKRYYADNGEDAFILCCQHMPEPDPDFEEPETLRES